MKTNDTVEPSAEVKPGITEADVARFIANTATQLGKKHLGVQITCYAAAGDDCRWIVACRHVKLACGVTLAEAVAEYQSQHGSLAENKRAAAAKLLAEADALTGNSQQAA